MLRISQHQRNNFIDNFIAFCFETLYNSYIGQHKERQQ